MRERLILEGDRVVGVGSAAAKTMYLIWSNEHRGWWKPGRHGYTTATHRAGLYSFEEASEIVTNANRFSKKIEEIMVEAPSREQIELDLTSPDR